MQKHLLDTTLPLSRDQYADRIDRMSTDSTTPYFHTKRGGIENNQNQKFRRWRASSEQDERNWIRINLAASSHICKYIREVEDQEATWRWRRQGKERT